jgi:hypothetical protein
MDTWPVNASTRRLRRGGAYDPSAGRGHRSTRPGPGTATLLPDGRVLVAGGISVRGSYDSDVLDRAPGWLSSAELYDAGSR